MPKLSHAAEQTLERVQKATFGYFTRFQNHETGLIMDRSRSGPATIAGVGFALAAYPVAVKRGWIGREVAVEYALKVLKTLANAPQGDAAEGTSGNHGFFYHMLDSKTGLRALGKTSPDLWDSELSTIDTALLMIGVRFARTYFDKRNADEKEIRQLCDFLFDRIEWRWMMRDDFKILHGWTPEKGKFENVYEGYSEALILYLLALAPKHNALPSKCWRSLLQGVKAESRDGGEKFISLRGNPLFCFQYPHCFFDFRGIMDALNRRSGFDYFQNSVRATLAQIRYAIRNPGGWLGYSKLNFGLTACDGMKVPGGKKVIDGKERDFREYSERGDDNGFDGINEETIGFDDGTIAPTAAISSLPFTFEESMATIENWLKRRPDIFSDELGFYDAFNDTLGWVDPEYVAIDQGPIVLMIENLRSGFVWAVMRKDPAVRRALLRAGFRGGWLSRHRG